MRCATDSPTSYRCNRVTRRAIPRAISRVIPRAISRVLVGATVMLGCSFAIGACSSSSAKAEPCPAHVDVEVKATEYHFLPQTLTATAGKFVVKLVEGGSINHTFQIHGASGKAEVDAASKSGCATFTLTKGPYTYYCGVSGHEGQGMKGTLTVS